MLNAPIVLAAHHTVADLPAALEFFLRLGFEVRERSEQLAVVDNGALTLRLVAAPPTGPLHLEVSARDLLETLTQFATDLPEFTASGPLARVAERWLEQRFAGPHGVTVTVSHRLGEDELAAPPPLATELPWEPAAVALVQDILRLVPETFRPSARRRVVRYAEATTVAEGEVEVTPRRAAASLLAATPDFQAELLRAELACRGFREG